MAKKPSKPRAEGMIRRRGNSFQAIVFAGMDPVTGRQLYLRGSSSSEAEAKRMLRKFHTQVAEQRHARTRASLRTTVEAWLETHELEESTREGYLTYANRHIYPVLGEESGRSPHTFWSAFTPSSAGAAPDATAGLLSSTGSVARTSAGRSGTGVRRAGGRQLATRHTTARRRDARSWSAVLTLPAAGVRDGTHDSFRHPRGADCRRTMGLDHVQPGRARPYPTCPNP